MMGSKLRQAIFPLLTAAAFCGQLVANRSCAQSATDKSPLRIDWKDDFLTIRGGFPGGEIRIHYLEAYCRPGSTDRDWGATVIGHHAESLSASADGRELKLRDTLRDGVTVEHSITAGADEIDFRLAAHNPTDRESLAHWAQPCIRVDKFTNAATDDQAAIQPKYIRQCFLFIDGKLTRLPTQPWADKARYVFGQVYCPRRVDRNDVNPRPLSSLVPSSGLCGCFSADEKWIMAVAWEPYQEIFQGVATCLHSDFRIGGLKPGETKNIRGKIYIVPADVAKLVARYKTDFPEQVEKSATREQEKH
jgi:hypothetical protein